MDSDFLVFLAIFSGVMGLVFFGIAIANRCPACGSLTHGFKSDKVGDLDTGHAYFVCRKCGDKQLKGQVAADGSVMWYGGGSGNFDKNGDYTGDAGGAFGDGGGGDGGGGDGGGGGGE